MKPYLLTYRKKRQYVLFAGDILALALSIVISYAVRIYLNQEHPFVQVLLSRINPWQISVIAGHLFTLYLLDLYNLDRLMNRARASIMVVFSVWLAGLILSGALFFMPKYVFGRQVLLIHLIVVSVFMVVWRTIFATFQTRGADPKRLVAVGQGEVIGPFIKEISELPNNGFACSGVCMIGPSEARIVPLSGSLKQYPGVQELLASNDFDVLAVDRSTSAFSEDDIRQILELKYRGKAVYDLPTLYKNLTGKVPMSYIDGQWLLGCERLQGELDMAYIRPKRVFDVLFASLLLILTAPLFVLISVGIRLDSKGKVLFKQERLGLQKRPFTCLKFRTMIDDAESETGPIWSKVNDPRVTRVGRVLRAVRLDELPQLWNILKGEMSFVGPRPIRQHFADALTEKIPFYGLRFSVKPGLSGWAQVNYDYGGSEEGQLEKFQYELYYIENMSFLLDLWIIINTLHNMIRGQVHGERRNRARVNL